MATKLVSLQAEIAAAKAKVKELEEKAVELKEQEKEGHKLGLATLRKAHEEAVKTLLASQKEELNEYAATTGLTLTELGLRKTSGRATTRTSSATSTPKRASNGKAKFFLAGVTYLNPDKTAKKSQKFVGGTRGPVPQWMIDANASGTLDSLAVRDSAYAVMTKLAKDRAANPNP